MKNFSLNISLAVILIFSFTSNIYAQFEWEQLPGLAGGQVEVLANNGAGDLFIGTGTLGIFKSTDSGNSWIEKNNGLTTSNVISLAIDSNDFIYAGTFNAGIFRSRDDGEIWEQINNGLTMTNIRSIVFNDSGYIFACSGSSPFSGGVFRSTNNGDNWTEVNNGLPFGAIFSLAIDNNNNVYAGSGFNGGVYISTNNGDNWTATGVTNVTTMSLTIAKSKNIIYAGTYTNILKSTDSGISWSSTGLSGNIWALTTNASGDVFAGTWAGSIFRSSDDGSSWVNLIDELTIVQDILITQSGGIFAGTFGPGVFNSTDNGNNWENKSAGIDLLNIRDTHIASNGNIFAGSGMVYRSTNNGANWSYVKGGSGNSWYNSIVTNSQGIVFAANAGLSGGYWIYRSTDNGDSWTRITNGVTDSTIWTIALDSVDNVFIGTNAGVYKSTDNGDTWIPINTGLTSNKVRKLVLKNNNTLFAGTYPSGLFRSTDGGNNWVSVLNGITGSNWLSIAIDSVGNIYTGSASGGSGIYRSTNNGDSWVKADTGITDLNILSLTANDNDVFAGTQTGGIFHSSDNGQSWNSMNEGFQTIDIINSLYIDDNYIYAGTKGLWRRQLSGVAPMAPTNLIAVADTFSVALSWTDNSDNETGFKIERKDDSLQIAAPWILIDSVGANVTSFIDAGLTPNSVYSYRMYAFNATGNSAYSDSVEIVTIVPVELTSFIASVGTNGVTLNWTTATELNNSGFEIERKSANSSFEKIGFVAGFGTTTELKSYSFSDENVTTGKYNYRLKQIDFDGTFEYSNAIEVNVDITPTKFALDQNFPNPFNPRTTIKYSIPSSEFVSIKVYDVIGNEIANLVDVKQEAGKYEVSFDASSLSSGIYLYKIQAGSFVQTKKMMLMK